MRFQPFFFPKLQAAGVDGVQRWVAKVHDIDSVDMLLFPIHLNDTHWSLVVARMKTHELEYYDSLDMDGHKVLKQIERFLKKSLKVKGWTRRPRSKCWKQNNTYDCGVHVCRTAFLLAIGQSASIVVDSKGDTTRFRQKIKRCILSGKLR
eukprot:m.83305 g.83305  ORF g.83305 m.83305 type:complete len:150 (-) comp9530_c0_seq1:151-600(-)